MNNRQVVSEVTETPTAKPKSWKERWIIKEGVSQERVPHGSYTQMLKLQTNMELLNSSAR